MRWRTNDDGRHDAGCVPHSGSLPAPELEELVRSNKLKPLARCIEHTRWVGDTGSLTSSYVNQRCPTRWASAQPSYDCGGENSTLHTKKGFSIPVIARSLIANESKDPNLSEVASSDDDD